MIYPAITLYQPWAQFIMLGWKIIETRLHNKFACLNEKTILIHAGAYWDDDWFKLASHYLTHEQLFLMDTNIEVEPSILCSAKVYDYGTLNQSHSNDALIDCFGYNRKGLFLKDIEKTKPFPVAGSVGIFYFDTITGKKVKKPENL
jgi:hypothetical protein